MTFFRAVLLCVCGLAGCEGARHYPETVPMPPELAKRCDYLVIGAKAIDAKAPGYRTSNKDERLVMEPRSDRVDVYYQLPGSAVGGSGHALIDPATCRVTEVFFDE